jgi:hypothetical protein
MARPPHGRTIASALSDIDERLDADPLLSAAEREQIREKARQHVKKKRKDKAESELLAKLIREEEVALNPFEQTEDVQINIAPYVANEKLKACCISLDGRLFFHGLVYQVPYSVARTLEDIMARTWEHEREIKGDRRKADVNRRPLLPTLHSGQENMQVGRDAGTVNTRQSVLSADQEI